MIDSNRQKVATKIVKALGSINQNKPSPAFNYINNIFNFKDMDYSFLLVSTSKFFNIKCGILINTITNSTISIEELQEILDYLESL